MKTFSPMILSDPKPKSNYSSLIKFSLLGLSIFLSAFIYYCALKSISVDRKLFEYFKKEIQKYEDIDEEEQEEIENSDEDVVYEKNPIIKRKQEINFDNSKIICTYDLFPLNGFAGILITENGAKKICLNDRESYMKFNEAIMTMGKLHYIQKFNLKKNPFVSRIIKGIVERLNNFVGVEKNLIVTEKNYELPFLNLSFLEKIGVFLDSKNGPGFVKINGYIRDLLKKKLRSGDNRLISFYVSNKYQFSPISNLKVLVMDYPTNIQNLDEIKLSIEVLDNIVSYPKEENGKLLSIMGYINLLSML